MQGGLFSGAIPPGKLRCAALENWCGRGRCTPRCVGRVGGMLSYHAASQVDAVLQGSRCRGGSDVSAARAGSGRRPHAPTPRRPHPAACVRSGRTGRHAASVPSHLVEKRLGGTEQEGRAGRAGSAVRPCCKSCCIAPGTPRSGPPHRHPSCLTAARNARLPAGGGMQAARPRRPMPATPLHKRSTAGKRQGPLTLRSLSEASAQKMSVRVTMPTHTPASSTTGTRWNLCCGGGGGGGGGEVEAATARGLRALARSRRSGACQVQPCRRRQHRPAATHCRRPPASARLPAAPSRQLMRPPSRPHVNHGVGGGRSLVAGLASDGVGRHDILRPPGGQGNRSHGSRRT